MPQKKDRPSHRRIRAAVLQPVLSFVARRNRATRTLAAAMQMRCAACGATLARHIAAGNRWKGCAVASGKGGAR